MAAFKFYLESGKQRKATRSQVRQGGWVGHGGHVFGKKKSLVKKEVLLAPKLSVKSPHIFTLPP
jgi:hypothetical protein